MNLERLQPFGPLLLRLGLAGVFLWFGLNQIVDFESFIGYLPPWTAATGLSDKAFVQMNGVFETVFGLLLLVGLGTRLVALALGVHLLGIAFSLGYNDVMIRDFGLAVATFSLVLLGPSVWSLDKMLQAKQLVSGKIGFFLR